MIHEQILAPAETSRRIKRLLGCKWSFTVYELLKSGICRPGQMVRSVEGLTTKVLNECLQINTEFGILRKIIYPESPPRVEYEFTDYGRALTDLLDQILKL